MPSGTLLTGQLPGPSEAESTGVRAWGCGGGQTGSKLEEQVETGLEIASVWVLGCPYW